MSWKVGKVRAENIPNVIGDYRDFLVTVATKIQSLNSSWSFDAVIYDTTKTAVTLTFHKSISSIIGLNQGLKTFTIIGNQLSRLAADMPVGIRGSTGNDAIYYVSSFSLNGPNTDVIVNEAIPDPTVDGTMYIEASAQAVMAIATSSYPVSNSNLYQDNVQINKVVEMSFKPSASSDFYAKITDTVNPFDTATFCSDAGAYRFIIPYFESTDYLDRHEGNWWFSVEDTDAGFYIFYTKGTFEDDMRDGCLCFIDDDVQAFEQLSNPLDSEQSLFGAIGGLYQDGPIVESSTAWNDSTGHRLSIRDYTGAIIEGFRPFGRTGSFNYTYESDSDGYIRERMSLSRAHSSVTPTWEQGRKGIISADVMSLIRGDAKWNRIVYTGSKYFLHIRYGLVIPWESNKPPIF